MKKIKDICYGSAVGDALGVPVEGYRSTILLRNPVREMKKGGLNQKEKGTFSNETSLMIAGFDSIKRKGEIDFEDIMESYSNWLFNAEYTTEEKAFGINETMFNAINKFKSGVEPLLCGDNDERTTDTAGLTRITPIILFLYEKYGNEFYTNDDALYYLFGATELTNANDETLLSSIYLSVLLSKILDENTIEKSINLTNDFMIDEFNEEEIFSKFKRLLDIEYIKNVDEKLLKTEDDCIKVLECVVYCLLTTKTFDELVLKAVNLGGVADIIGFICGAVGGAFYGFDNISTDFLADLKGKNLIEGIIK